MAKRMTLSVCLLTSIFFAGVPVQAATTTSPTAPHVQYIAQEGISQTIYQLAAQQTATDQAILSLKDLPSGFRALPPRLAAEIASQLDVLRQQLGQGNIKPENFFAFVNPKNLQLVLGFTGKLPNQPEQADFDTSLQKLQQPETQQKLISQLQESAKAFGEMKVTEYRTVPELNNLANASTGLTLTIELQGQPLRADVAAFRRNAVGAFTAVMYVNGKEPMIEVGDVAQKLDDRITRLSANEELGRRG